jgi:hypothetical protein
MERHPLEEQQDKPGDPPEPSSATFSRFVDIRVDEIDEILIAVFVAPFLQPAAAQYSAPRQVVPEKV